MQRLTPKQARFVQEYLQDRNGAQAAIRAGYSPNGARETAYRLLTYAHVRQSVERELERTAEQLRVERADIIRGLLEAAEDAKLYGDVAGMVDSWREIAILLGHYPIDCRVRRPGRR